MKAHASRNDHVSKETLLPGKTNQGVFVFAYGKQMTLSSSSVVLSPTDQVTNAEIIPALNCVDSNFSSASMNNDAKKRMLTDTKIVESFRQAETKAKYVLQFGIVSYLRKNMLKDFKDQPFNLNLENQQRVKLRKQYNAYAQFRSSLHQQVVNRYCGSLFVGYCGGEELLNHFFQFGNEMGWDNRLLLHIGMNGPNVNLKLQQEGGRYRSKI